MKILLMPDYDSTREDMGFDESDDYDNDAILFQQGFDSDIIEVEDGETFTIPEDYLGQIVEDGNCYYMTIEVVPGSWEQWHMEEGESIIDPGVYRLEGDLIREIESNEKLF